MIAIKQGFSLLPVSRLEQHFGEEELRGIALMEFRHLEDAMSALAKQEHPRGMTPMEAKQQCRDLLSLHYGRWGRRGSDFHAAIVDRLPDWPDFDKS